ncbi:ImmA/IrrE family metallo-endopeptidase [Nocardia puris]|nr:ImmA/IrrE family metallo-endopeptidase [Nocardia puris]
MSQAVPPLKSSREGNDPPRVTLAKLRAIAAVGVTPVERSLHLARRQAEMLLDAHPVDTGMIPAEVITELRGIRVEWVPGQRLPSAGFWDTAARQWVIQLAYADSWKQQRWALAREFKHILDYPHADDLYPSTDATSSRYLAEQAADHFADHLLVPDRLLRRAWSNDIGTAAELSVHFSVPEFVTERRLVDTPLGLDTGRARRHRAADVAGPDGGAA